MSWLVNATPVSGAEANFNVKVTLNIGTNGTNATIPTSANGLVYAQSGDVIRTAADLANANAWYVLRWPGVIDIDVLYYTEMCVQTNGTTGLRVKISYRSGFTGGTPSPTQTPSAVDEQYLWGGGTDASPTFTNFWAANGQRQQGYSSESNANCWFGEYPIGGGPMSRLFFVDCPQPNPRGSGNNLLDKTRIVFYMATGSNSALCDGLSTCDTAPFSTFQYGEADQLWGRCPPQMMFRFPGPTRVLPGGCATSPIYDIPVTPELPFFYVRDVGMAGTLYAGEVGDSNTCDDKGTSTMVRYAGQRQTTPRLFDAVDPESGQATVDSVFALGDILLSPWPGTALLV